MVSKNSDIINNVLLADSHNSKVLSNPEVNIKPVNVSLVKTTLVVEYFSHWAQGLFSINPAFTHKDEDGHWSLLKHKIKVKPAFLKYSCSILQSFVVCPNCAF